MLKNIIRVMILTVVVLLFAVRCASISSPTGGPRDSIPPRLIRTFPDPYSTNFKDKKITLEFNEFIQLRDQQKNFFVSPPGSRKPLLTIKNKSVVIEFEDPLDSATTYRLDFGNSIVDNNEGNPMDGYSFVFSTGESIDSLIMAGQVIDARTRDTVINAMIFFFGRNAGCTVPDSTMFNSHAEALFRSDSSGYFIADILKDKAYGIYALYEKDNSNQRYESGDDMIGFVDTVYNPTLMSGFTLEYDSLARRMNIEGAKVTVEVFKEIPVRPQILSKSERPLLQKLLFTFNAPGAVIDTIEMAEMDTTWLVRDVNKLGDSITYWINPPPGVDMDAVPDTIRGRIVYQRHDSLRNLVPYSQNFTLGFRKPVDKQAEKLQKKAKKQKLTKAQKKARKEAKRQARLNRKRGRVDPAMPSTEILPLVDSLNPIPDNLVSPALDTAMMPVTPPDTVATDAGTETGKPPPVNPFKFAVNARTELNPLENIVFTFDLPVLEIDTANIGLVHIIPQTATGSAREQLRQAGRQTQQQAEGQQTEPVPFTFEPVGGSLHQWMLQAEWRVDESYTLTIPAGVMKNIARQSNDTLVSNFKIASPEKFGTIVIQTQADSTLTSSYIFELVPLNSKGSDKTTNRIAGVKAGEKVDMYYIQAGDYRLRVVEDANHNGEWDTGSLTQRRQPEKVRIWTQGSPPSQHIIAKENWEVELSVDLNELFSEF